MFEESAAAVHNDHLFGLPFSVKESEIVIIPVPWEVTVSFRPGTANGPEAIREASYQIDLYDPPFATGDQWKQGFAMERINEVTRNEGRRLRAIAEHCIRFQEQGVLPGNQAFLHAQQEVNQGCELLNSWVKEKSFAYLQGQKLVGIVGGDHSVPLGLMQALAEYHGSYGILHIDAHYDQRDAFEGFKFSHASIMRNASRIEAVEKIVHVGIRDYCKEEANYVAQSPKKFITFTDWNLACDEFIHTMSPWLKTCDNIIGSLPERVYISFDIDGLDPSLCPHTGTPVPGGLSFQQVSFLLLQLLESGRRIIGFDLCEVAPGSNDFARDWDANVGARILYRLCSLLTESSLSM